MIKDLREYFNLDRKEVIWLMKSGTRLNAVYWHILNPKTNKEIQNFYQTNPFSVFSLAFWHSKTSQRLFRSKVISLAQGEILDYGAGIGDLCLKLAKKGFNIDYADVCGKTFEFAKWLFQKKGCDIKMIDLTKNKLSKKYDTIICIDVIEHLINPRIVLKDFAAHLRNKGKLIITNLNSPVLKEHPMHIEMKFKAEEYLNSLGIVKLKEPWLWQKSL